MPMTVPVAQMRIARDITEAERALDEALIRNASLFGTMVAARRETAAGPFVGHEALVRLSKSQQSLLDAGGNLARVHGSLLDVQREMGARDDCPPDDRRLMPDQRIAG
jgi:hypothetical protein